MVVTRWELEAQRKTFKSGEREIGSGATANRGGGGNPVIIYVPLSSFFSNNLME